MKNIGWTKKFATKIAETCCTSQVDAYVQKEEHFWSGGTYQWIVVLQKKGKVKVRL